MLTKDLRHSLIIALICPLIGLLAAVPYLGSLEGDFVWDDIYLIRDNTNMDHPDYVREIWLNDYFGLSTGVRSHFWRPLVRFSMWLDYIAYGRIPDGFHLTNLILFGLTASVIFLFFMSIFCDLRSVGLHRPSQESSAVRPAVTRSAHAGSTDTGSAWTKSSDDAFRRAVFFAGLAALLFAWHPLRVEVAAWISCRTETLMMLFGIAALTAFGKSIDNERRLNPAMLFSACLLLCLSLLSKESAILFPLLALTVFGARIRRHPFSWGMFWIPVAAWAIFRHFAVGYRHWFPRIVEPLLVPAVAGRAFFHYILIHVWPVGLSPEPWFPLPETYLDKFVLIGLAIGCFFVGAFLFRRNIVTAGALWFTISLLPFLHILPLPERAADRYTTMASAGFVMMIVGLPLMVRRRWLRSLCAIPLVAIAVIWAIGAHALTPVWFTDQSIMVRSAQFGQSPQALFYRGDKAFTNQDFKAAYDAYKVALDRAEKPSAVQFYHLALTELELDIIVDAVAHLQMVTDMEPNHPMAGVMLGEIFMRQKKFPEAVRIMESQARLHPENPVPHLVLGTIYGDFLDQPSKARDCFRRALERDTAGIHRAFIIDRLNRLDSR